MLDLEIVPERSLGCDAWEFVLGELFRMFITNVKILRCISTGTTYAIVFLYLLQLINVSGVRYSARRSH